MWKEQGLGCTLCGTALYSSEAFLYRNTLPCNRALFFPHRGGLPQTHQDIGAGLLAR